MKKFLIILLVIGSLDFAQAQRELALMTSSQTVKELKDNTPAVDLAGSLYKLDFSDEKAVLESIQKVVNADNSLNQYASNSKTAYVIVRKKLNGSIEHLTSIYSKALSSVDTAKLIKSDYILGRNNVVFIMIGTEEFVDQLSFQEDESTTKFKQDFEEIKNLFKKLSVQESFLDAKADSVSVDLKLLIRTYSQSEVPYPGAISVSQGDEEFEVKIHEESSFSIQLGVSTQQLDRQIFSIDNNELTIELNDDQKESWKSSLNVSLAWYPFGMDFDRAGSYKQGLHRRVGFFGGLKFASDPIQELYLGVTFVLHKNISLNAGAVWVNQFENGITDIGTITDLDQALTYARREYKGEFFIGLSFTPKAISGILGL